MSGVLRYLSVVMAMTVGFMTTVFAQQEPRVALLIGNQAYDKAVGALKNPYNDIKLVAAALRQTGFEVMPLVRDASRLEILSAVRRYTQKLKAAGPDAVGFFYYSGHGAAETDVGPNYLIPVNVRNTDDSSMWDASVKLKEIVKRLKRGAPRTAHFVVFDACRNELQTQDKSVSKGFVPELNEGGVYIAFATAQNRKASDQGEGSGPYAQALAAEIVKPGQHHMDMFFNVKTEVRRRINQTPWDRNGLFKRIYFAGRKIEPASEPKPKLPVSSFDARAADLAYWNAIKDSEDPGDFKGYIVQFPKGIYVRPARRQIKKLENGTQTAALQPAAPTEPATTAAGLEGKDLALAVQRELQRVGCDPGTPDGWWGANSTEAVRAYGTHAKVTLNGTDPSMDILERLRNERSRVCPEGPQTGKTFKDCSVCPEMVVVPAGSFMMGSNSGDEDEKPVHRVTIAKPFAVGKFEVTFDEWDACVGEGGCQHKPWHVGWGRGKRPVINVSWDNIDQQYLPWLKKKTGQPYRLLAEAEWEYAARAGTSGPFSWDGEISTSKANYNGNYTYDGSAKGEYRKKTMPVKSFEPNVFGLYQVHGNVWEWVQDCWNQNYNGAGTDSAAKTTGDCSQRVLRGGSWNHNPRSLRTANRGIVQAGSRSNVIGFRLARTLNP